MQNTFFDLHTFFWVKIEFWTRKVFKTCGLIFEG